jgi:hypothetical protein
MAGKLTLDKPSAATDSTHLWAMDLGAPELFRSSCFSVVPETRFNSGGRNVTEKAIKTLALHPIVLLGDVGALASLRELGFQTFSPVFDERYDTEPDPARRAEMVVDEVARLARMRRASLQEHVLATDAARLHNEHWLRSGGFYELLLRETIRPLVRHLCERVAAAST